MKRTRRAILGTGAGVATGLAGCLSVDGVEYPAATEDAPETVEAATTPEDGDGGDARDEGDAANEALAAATRDVVTDAVWFATEWPAAVEAHREAVADVVETVADVRAAVRAESSARQEHVDRVELAGLDAAERSEAALAPHFTPGDRMVARTVRHVEDLRRFADRDDVDRVVEELTRMHDGFAGIGTWPYVERHFSRRPVDNRLLRRLLYPLPDDTTRRREVLETTMAEVRVASEGFGTVARLQYDDDRWTRDQTPRIYGNAFPPERQAELRARVGPVTQPEDREVELFVAFARRPQPDESPAAVFEGWPTALDPVPVYVQAYPDADVAADRFDAITAAGTTEDTEPIGPGATKATAEPPTTWHRFYHHEAESDRYQFDEHEGVQYGYVARAGEFVLATGFSGDAWEERVRWQGRLEHGWVTV